MSGRTERLLLEDAESYGWAGIKVDIGTGAGFHVDHNGGDLIIGKPVQNLHTGMLETDEEAPIYSDLLIIEEKYRTSEKSVYIQEDGDKLDGMIEFSEAIGATPVFAVRWSNRLDRSPGSSHYLKDARDVERTKAGNISIKPETAEERFTPTKDFFTEPKVEAV